MRKFLFCGDGTWMRDEWNEKNKERKKEDSVWSNSRKEYSDFFCLLMYAISYWESCVSEARVYGVRFDWENRRNLMNKSGGRVRLMRIGCAFCFDLFLFLVCVRSAMTMTTWINEFSLSVWSETNINTYRSEFGIVTHASMSTSIKRDEEEVKKDCVWSQDVCLRTTYAHPFLRYNSTRMANRNALATTTKILACFIHTHKHTHYEEAQIAVE